MSNRTSNNKYHVSLQNHQCLRHMYQSHTYSILVKKKLGLSVCLSGLLPSGVAVLNNSSTCWFWPYGPKVVCITSCHQQLPCRLLGMSCPSPFSLSLVLSNFTLEEVPWRKTLPTWRHDSKLRSTGGCKYLARTSSLFPLNIRCKAGTMSQLVWHTGSSESVHI